MTQTLILNVPDDLIEEIASRVIALLEERRSVAAGCGPLTLASPYLNVREAAAYIRAKPQRIYDLLSAGRLTRHKEGSRVLVARAELDALLIPRQRVAPVLPNAWKPR